MGSKLPQTHSKRKESPPQAVARILSEAQDWERVMALDFGRKHLALTRAKLSKQGLARDDRV